MVLLIGVSLFCACTQSDNMAPSDKQSATLLTAGFGEDVEARTYLEEGLYMHWHADDRITTFYGNTLNCEYRFLGKTGDTSGQFQLVADGTLGTGNNLDKNYAVYPFDANTTISDLGAISCTLPTTQSYAPNSFGIGANTMVAVTKSVEDTFLAFKNVGGFLKIKMYGDATISNIVLRGNNGEPIAGSATIVGSFDGVPSVEMGADATTTITLDCGEGVALGDSAETATNFWFVVPETTFTKGITIVATDASGNTFEQSTSNTVKVERNTITPMQAFEYSKQTSVTATLTYDECKSILVKSYGNTKSYTNSFGTWTICVYDNSNAMQINSGKVAYIGTPTFEGDIKSITLTFDESYSGDILLCSECGTTAVSGQFESFGCGGKAQE